MWGTSSHDDELTGDFGNEPEAISIGDFGLFRPPAGNLSTGDLGLLQQYPLHCRHPDPLPRTAGWGQKRTLRFFRVSRKRLFTGVLKMALLSHIPHPVDMAESDDRISISRVGA
jgi:hypothetical protein